MTTTVENKSRRSFLNNLLAAWAGLVSVPFFYVISRFIYPPIRKEKIVESMDIGRSDEIIINSAKIFKFNKKPIIVVHTSQDQFKAFSAICTHLGCVVEFKPEGGGYFYCNCHGSVFDLTGKNIKGPAPTPLEPIKVSLKDSGIMLSIPRG